MIPLDFLQGSEAQHSQALVTCSPGTYFTNGLWAYTWKIIKNILVQILILMIQLGHSLAHAMTAQLSWHVQNYDLIHQTVFTYKHHMFLQDLGYELINHWWNSAWSLTAAADQAWFIEGDGFQPMAVANASF